MTRVEPKLNLNAYYYGFNPTGVVGVDRVLSAVADAGSGYHNTEDWSEKGLAGKSAADRIQDAANTLAAEFAALRGPAVDAEALAKLFHTTYERLAWQFNYETRKETQVPWPELPEQNRLLMIATCREILAALRPSSPPDEPPSKTAPVHFTDSGVPYTTPAEILASEKGRDEIAKAANVMRPPDEPSVARERFEEALRGYGIVHALFTKAKQTDRDFTTLGASFMAEQATVLALYDEAASRSPAPPVKVTDEDVGRAWSIFTSSEPGLRRVLEDYASRQGGRK